MIIPDYSKLPDSLDTLTLGSWIRFYRKFGKELDTAAEEIEGLPEGRLRDIDITDHHVDRMYRMAEHFTGMSAMYCRKEFSVQTVATMYNERFVHMFAGAELVGISERFEFNGMTWKLPPVTLTPTGPHRFGEFIDSKSVVEDIQQNKLSRWELIHQIAAIFLRPDGEEHKDEHLETDSARLTELMELPMRIALTVGNWFDAFNEHLRTSYHVFQPSSLPSSQHMKKHFTEWGWVNFLKTIATTKIFDIPGSPYNSIEAARRASLFDVLIYAGEEKSLGEATYWDMKEKNNK